MVHYKGTPLALFTLPASTEKEPTKSRARLNDTETLATTGNVQPKIRDPDGLIACWDDMAQLLTNCRKMPIGFNELVPMDSFLPANFWESDNEADISQSFLQELPVDF